MKTGFEVLSALTETYSLDLDSPVRVRAAGPRFVRDHRTANAAIRMVAVLAALFTLPTVFVAQNWYTWFAPMPQLWPLFYVLAALFVPVVASLMVLNALVHTATRTTIEARPGALHIGGRSFPWTTIDSIQAGGLLVRDGGKGMKFTAEALVVKTKTETLAWQVRHIEGRDLDALGTRLEAVRIAHSIPAEVPEKLQQLRRAESA